MTSISPTEKKSESDSSEQREKIDYELTDTAGKKNANESSPRTENSSRIERIQQDLQSAGAQLENLSDDQSGNSVVDRGKDSKPVEKKGGDGLAGDTENVHKEKDENMTQIPSGSQIKNTKSETLNKADEGNDLEPEIEEKDLQSAGAQFENLCDDQSGNSVVERGKDSKPVEEKGGDTQSSDFTNVDTEINGKTTNASHTEKKEDEKRDSKSGVGSSGDSGKKSVTSPKEGKTTNASYTGKKEDEKHDSKSEMTKLLPSAQTETKTVKQVKEKSPSKSDVGSSGDSRQVKVNEESPPRPPYSKLPQQIPPKIREGTDNNLLWIGIVVVLVSVACGYFLHFSGSTPNKIPEKLDMVKLFNHEMKKLQASFPSQHPELWKRSLIHIRRHLRTEHPTEPVSLILTSGRRAEKTLGCLAQCLAQAFSTTRNSTFLNIDGKGKTSLDSDQVKLDIDSELTKAFESEKFAAVIHRFEELPPGSTLIFYRYCDHENAAYKNVFLAFTVMLDAEAELPSNVNLGRIEEMVQDHVKHKFVLSDKSAVFNQMDMDKLSGLWSRISHLVLPVAAEERIEQQGCEGLG